MQERFPGKRIIASLLVIAVVIVVMVKSDVISWDGVMDSLKRIGVPSFLLALCMSLAQYICIALRFVVLLAREGVAPFHVSRIFTNGQLLNHLFPARAGDLYKVVALKKESTDPRFSTAHVVSALILERAISTLVLFTLIIVFADWSMIRVTDLSFVDRTRQIQAAIAVVVLGILSIYLAQRKFPKLRAWLLELKRGFLVILDLRRFTLVVCMSVAMWTLEVLSLKFLAAPLDIELQFGQGFTALLFLNLGIAVPVTLGNIGTYEASLALGLGLWGIGISDGIAIAMSHHFLQISSLVILAAVLGATNVVMHRTRVAAASSRSDE